MDQMENGTIFRNSKNGGETDKIENRTYYF